MGFISRINCFREIKNHILAVHCNVQCNNSKSMKVNSNELTFMGKTTKIRLLQNTKFCVHNTLRFSGLSNIENEWVYS